MAKKVNTIDDAINVLDEAARESTQGVKSRLSADYEYLKKTVEDMKPTVSQAWDGVKTDMKDRSKRSVDSAKDSFYAARDIGKEVSKDAAVKLDKNVKQDPWKYVRGAAAASALLGFLFGRRMYRRKSRQQLRERD